MSKTEHKYLKGIPAKFFEESRKADNCPYCGTRMIHPSDGLFICPNEACQYTFKFYPESKNKPIEVINKSKLEAFK